MSPKATRTKKMSAVDDGYTSDGAIMEAFNSSVTPDMVINAAQIARASSQDAPIDNESRVPTPAPIYDVDEEFPDVGEIMSQHHEDLQAITANVDVLAQKSLTLEANMDRVMRDYTEMRREMTNEIRALRATVDVLKGDISAMSTDHAQYVDDSLNKYDALNSNLSALRTELAEIKLADKHERKVKTDAPLERRTRSSDYSPARSTDSREMWNRIQHYGPRPTSPGNSIHDEKNVAEVTAPFQSMISEQVSAFQSAPIVRSLVAEGKRPAKAANTLDLSGYGSD